MRVAHSCLGRVLLPQGWRYRLHQAIPIDAQFTVVDVPDDVDLGGANSGRPVSPPSGVGNSVRNSSSALRTVSPPKQTHSSRSRERSGTRRSSLGAIAALAEVMNHKEAEAASSGSGNGAVSGVGEMPQAFAEPRQARHVGLWHCGVVFSVR